jgi:hypothetical protein
MVGVKFLGKSTKYMAVLMITPKGTITCQEVTWALQCHGWDSMGNKIGGTGHLAHRRQLVIA